MLIEEDFRFVDWIRWKLMEKMNELMEMEMEMEMAKVKWLCVCGSSVLLGNDLRDVGTTSSVIFE